MFQKLLLFGGAAAFLLMSLSLPPQPAKKWVCKPCGSDCDKEEYDAAGECKHCHMPLVDPNTIRFTNIPIIQTCDKLKDPSVIALDVRTPAEFNGTAPDKFGRIKDAINIPIQEIESRIGELEKYKDREILVYCSHSHRSPQVAWLLNQRGFKKVDNLASGMSVWSDSVRCEEYRMK